MKNYMTFTKIGVYLTLFLLVLACSTSSDDTEPTGQDDEQNNNLETFNFTLNFNVGFSDLTTATIYLSDANGAILDQAPVLDYSQMVLTTDGEENAKYDVSMVYKTIYESGNISYGVNMFLDMEDGIYNYEYEYNYVSYDPILLSIYNIGERPVIITNLGIKVFGQNYYSFENGGTVDFKYIFPYREEFGGQYLSIQKLYDDFERYYWSQSPPLTEPLELDYFDLPILENMITLEAPSGVDIVRFNIFGFHPSNTLDVGNKIADQTDILTENLGVYGVPEGIFNRYNMELGYLKNNLYYFINRTQNSPFTTYPQSDLDLSVNNSSLNNFSATSSGNYDIFDVNYTFENEATNENYNILIIGAKSDAFSFSMETLLSNIFENQLNVNDLEYQRTKLKGYSYINSYQSYIQVYFENHTVPERGLEYESVGSY